MDAVQAKSGQKQKRAREVPEVELVLSNQELLQAILPVEKS